MKKIIKVLLATVFCILFLAALCAGGFVIFYTPTLTADMSEKTGSVTTGASGYLYGIAEPGVPSVNMTESVDISTVSVKVPDGLQHPIGDVEHIANQLNNTDYIVVYLQDAYSTWYYEQDSIEEMRSKNTYDWQTFLNNDYLSKVEKAVKELSKTDYSDKIVYCIYNECDNGVWFGETKEKSDSKFGVYGEYNEQGAADFFSAWKQTYDLVKSIDSDALIGGPGFCDYDKDEIKYFMTCCSQNNCVPQVMIYHELNDSSVYHWQSHVENYRELEGELGIDKLPIIVTEYGRMQDNGMPGKMLQYITQIETSKVYADNAYWRLADNLCDVAADDNSPNSNWWLYRWYADMQGQTVDIKYQDLFKSNVGKAISGKADFASKGFMGLVTIDEREDVFDSRIEVICGGRDGSAVVKLKNLDDTVFVREDSSRVRVTIEEVVYKGLSGTVNSTEIKRQYYTDIKNDILNIDMNDMDESSAYRITVIPFSENSGTVQTDYQSDRFVKRFEFEDGELLGNAYTYESAYATTGDKDGMVGGMGNDGDGISLTFDVPEDGTYNLDIIYGNSNDGEADDNDVKNPDDRTFSSSMLSLDGNETEVSFENTIKSEYTNCLSVTYELAKGEHTILFKHAKGTITLDSMLVSTEVDEQIAVLDDTDRTDDSTQSYLIVAPTDGYYYVDFADDANAQLNGENVVLKDEDTLLYLSRGLNYLDIESPYSNGLLVKKADRTGEVINLDCDQAKLSGTASVSNNDFWNINYIDGISCNSGKAEFNVNVTKSGSYALTFLYSNNDEGGKHDYNVDLIERYVTVTANGSSQDVYCRNTYSWDTFKTVTCYVHLNEGENIIALTNSGNNKFDNQDTYAPHINRITVNEISAN